MKVLIVAKTRQGSRACVGGITDEGQSVRLRAADYDWDESAGMEYEVGEVWDVEGAPAPDLKPPHVESIVVSGKRKLGAARDPVGSIERLMPAACGSTEMLYEGLVQSRETGSLYITESSGIPAHSTMFWRPDQPLTRDDRGRRIRYRYPTPDGGRSLVFVGFQDPPEIIPEGTLLRVSLAHWWRKEDSDDELRCYVQLSGWFGLDGSTTAHPHMSIPPAGVESQDATSPGRLLKTVFGYDTFRPLQETIIANVLASRDTLAIMPTGSGKSLCYQLPALIFDGITVVVSPLISLMQDQVEQLRALGVQAAFLNSTVDYHGSIGIMKRARCGDIKLLYTSPETLLRPETLVMLDNCSVACLTVDEAHCISQWGHDFRTEYRQLLPVRQRYPDAVCVAFTATATHRVQDDIAHQLGMRDEDRFVASFDRPNLHLRVQRRTSGGLPQVRRVLQEHKGESGIIYCTARATVDRLAATLKREGWPVLPYHAGLDDETRRRHQALFSHDRQPVMIATIAFGMGINKSNVRFILHFNLPATVEHYYQEIGRAGRDGLPADCLLLYSQSDLYTIRNFIEEGAMDERAGRNARLDAMLRYAETQACRRDRLLAYFDEKTTTANCSACDNCTRPGPTGPADDIGDDARIFLATVAATRELYGAAHLSEVLVGAKTARILGRGHHKSPVYGSGRHRPKEYWRVLANQLIEHGALAQDLDHGGLHLTQRGRQILAGHKLLVSAAEAWSAVQRIATGYDVALFEQLRLLRKELADTERVPPYVILSDRSLVEIATRLPQSEAALLAVHGIGDHKLRKYGAQLLAVVSEHKSTHDAKQPPL